MSKKQAKPKKKQTPPVNPADVFCDSYEYVLDIAEMFCTDALRNDLRKPFHCGTKVYATNARCAVEIETGRTRDKVEAQYLADIPDEYSPALVPIKSALDNARRATREGKRRQIRTDRMEDAVRAAMADAISYGKGVDRPVMFPSAMLDAFVLVGGRKIVLNADYLRRALAVRFEGDEIRCFIGGAKDPVLFEGPGFALVIMPMKYLEDAPGFDPWSSVADGDTGKLVHSAKEMRRKV